MVEKSYLSIILSLSILLLVLPFDTNISASRAGERYDLETLPPTDENGNFTLVDEDEWDLLDHGYINGNITMYDDSIIIIDNANVTINGTI
jgi:hypothetical protein